MFSQGDWRSVFHRFSSLSHSVFQSDEGEACLSPVSFPLPVFSFVLQPAAVFCFCLTQNCWQEELKRISEERRGRRDKRCLSPQEAAEKHEERKVVGTRHRLVREHAHRRLPSPSLWPSQLFIIPRHLFRDRDMKANCRSKAGMRALGFFVRSLTSPLCPGFPRSRFLTTLYASHIVLLDDSITPSPSHLHFKPPLSCS